MRVLIAAIFTASCFTRCLGADFSNAVITPAGFAAAVLREEVQKRTGIQMPIVEAAVAGRPAILFDRDPAMAAESFRLRLSGSTLRITSADARGALYGVGHFLRHASRLTFDAPADTTEAPAYPIRGHQLGFRQHANSYDAWTVAQMEQYIRDLALFGANSIESIPFQDDRPSPVMKVTRREMNRAMSEICARYSLDYWAWVPADFDLNDKARRARELDRYSEFFDDANKLTALFFPGGDPGHNPPNLVLPFLADVARVLRARHPQARIWLSLQLFDAKQIDEAYKFIERESPDWLGGLVAGPSSPPIAETRARLPRKYKLRLYPDITHNKLSQYQVPGWDQAFARTLGREAINPRPAEYAAIHNKWAAYSDGFISYSDGAHDDVNKAIWTARAWNPRADVRDVLIGYARLHFGASVAEEAADAILALERNWRGPLIANGAVEAALNEWNRLERKAPGLAGNWRWQMCLLRANYDAFIRRKLIQETKFELAANAALETAPSVGSIKAMAAAAAILATAPLTADLRARIFDLCERLYQSIGLQTSVGRYHASDPQRGAMLDFVDLPLNNRWWLEDEFKMVTAVASEPERVQRLLALARWENPGPGSFYDRMGSVEGDREPTFWWIDQGKTRMRVSWQATQWPRSMVYEGLDPTASYAVRSNGSGQALLRMNGERVAPTADGRLLGEIKVFPVAAKHVKEARLVLTWDSPVGEEHLNWRQKSRLAEVWLIKESK